MASFNLKRFVRNPGRGLKNAGKSLGKVMDNKFVQAAGAAALATTGVGAPASAAILAGNRVTSTALRGKSVPKALPGIAREGIENAMAGQGQGGDTDWLEGIRSNGGIKLPPGVNVNSFTGGNGGRSAPTASGNTGGRDKGLKSIRKKLGLPPITFGNAAKAAGNSVRGAASYAKNNPMDLALLGLAGANAVGAVNATKRANRLSDSALDRTRSEYAARAPMREKGMQGAMNPTRPDLTDTFTWQSKPKRIAAAPVAAPATPAPATPADVRPSIPAPTGKGPGSGITDPFGIMAGGGGTTGVMKRAREYAAANPGTLGPGGVPYAPTVPDTRLAGGMGSRLKRKRGNALLQ